MTKTTEATQEEITPRCSDCLTKTIKKKIFSKEVYKCPKCSKSVDVTSTY